MMSGTSLDGIDLAAVTWRDGKIVCIATQAYAYPAHIKAQVLEIAQDHPVSIRAIGELDQVLGHLYADAALSFIQAHQFLKDEIIALGCHGQTVFHQPEGEHPFTLQLGDANVIAAKTGLVVVADFRRKDMALGGQGAPLVPAFHSAVFEHESERRVVLNIGGIANLTALIPGKSILGYDTGPGNMLMDAWIENHQGVPFDANGDWANQGRKSDILLNQLLSHPYFAKLAPKSTGRELFNLSWLKQQIEISQQQQISPEDVQSTLLSFTAKTIAQEVETYGTGSLYVCGGGARNSALMMALRTELPLWQVETTDVMGVDADYLEAIAFAWLAKQKMENKPANLPEVTGASRLCCLGVVYDPN